MAHKRRRDEDEDGKCEEQPGAAATATATAAAAEEPKDAVTSAATKPASGAGVAEGDERGNATMCVLTLENVVHPRVLWCGHAFEGSALLEWLETNRTCPICRQKMDYDLKVLGPPPNYMLQALLDALACAPPTAEAAAAAASTETAAAVAAAVAPEPDDAASVTALLDDAHALFALAQCFYDGHGMLRNYKKAAALYKMAAKRGHLEAKLQLATRCYRHGHGVARDAGRMLALLESASQRGLVEATYELAMCYQLRNFGYADVSKAAKLWTKAKAQGHVGSMVALARFHCADVAQQLAVVKHCMELGDPSACNIMALNYHWGKNGVPVDKIRAMELFEKAAALNHAPAQANLGMLLKESYDEKDKKRAFKLLRTASAAVDAEGAGDAMYHLATCYLKGIGTAKNEATGVAWLEKSVMAGHTTAMAELGLCCELGKGLAAPDKKRAFDLYAMASSLGNFNGHMYLGMCYRNGDCDTAVDHKKACVCFQLGVDQKHSACQRMLAECYEKGDGVLLDKEMALNLYIMAAEQGNQFASDKVIALLQDVSQ
jgi:TPR repeat protein